MQSHHRLAFGPRIHVLRKTGLLLTAAGLLVFMLAQSGIARADVSYTLAGSADCAAFLAAIGGVGETQESQCLFYDVSLGEGATLTVTNNYRIRPQFGVVTPDPEVNFTNRGTVNINSGGGGFGGLYNAGRLGNYGLINLNQPAQIYNVINNYAGGTLTLASSLYNGSSINNAGTITITSTGTLRNDGTIANSGTITVACGGSITGAGTITGNPPQFASCAPPGYYTNASGTVTPCAAGTYQPAANQTSCLLADPGYFVPGTASTLQSPCAVGTYQPASGAAACINAPAGSYVSGTGATTATLCAVGTYQPNTGASSCLSAPAGSYVSVPGATAATQCAAGSYQPNTGSVACILAAINYYVPTTGQTSQTPCPSLETTLTTGATSCVARISVLLAQVMGVVPGTSLTDKLIKVQAYIAANDKADACAGLTNFIGLAKAQTGKKLTAMQASSFIAQAQTIQAALGC